jgi:hypothetical protein
MGALHPIPHPLPPGGFAAILDAGLQEFRRLQAAGCTCDDVDPLCRHDEHPDADVCPGCGCHRDCPIHGPGDWEPDFEGMRDPW